MTTASPAAGPHAGAAGDARTDDRILAGLDPAGQVLRQHANGVAVITAGTDVPVGFCATSLAPVALNPAVLSFSVDIRSHSWATMATAEYVMAHVLADDQEDLARRFARTRCAKFGPTTRWHRGAHGLPVLDGVLARLLLVPINHVPVDDHVLVIGRMAAATFEAEGKGPLLHHNGMFGRLGPHDQRP